MRNHVRQIHTRRLDGLAESIPATSLDLDESDQSFPLHDKVDVSMAGPESPLDDSPTGSAKPPLRDPLSQLSERLLGR